MDRHDPCEDRVSLILHDRYTVDELATVLNIDPRRIEQAIFHRELAAEVVNHHVIGIERSAAIAWLGDGAPLGGE
jgi:hypothetical protein